MEYWLDYIIPGIEINANDITDLRISKMSLQQPALDTAEKFSADTGIACSPQAGREKVQTLKEKYMNHLSGQEEVVICELHTKFKTFNINREQQDRIYFFPGKQGILDGRIIVKHIGAHL